MVGAHVGRFGHVGNNELCLDVLVDKVQGLLYPVDRHYSSLQRSDRPIIVAVALLNE